MLFDLSLLDAPRNNWKEWVYPARFFPVWVFILDRKELYSYQNFESIHHYRDRNLFPLQNLVLPRSEYAEIFPLNSQEHVLVNV